MAGQGKDPLDSAWFERSRGQRKATSLLYRRVVPDGPNTTALVLNDWFFGEQVAQGGAPAPLPHLGLLLAPASGAYTLIADAGSYSLSGQDAGLISARRLTADAGSYSVSGQSANLVYGGGGYTLIAEAGNYTITGGDALADYTLYAEAGAYNLGGQDATLTYSPAGSPGSGGNPAPLPHLGLLLGSAGSYTLTADAGTYSLTGQAANLFAERRLVADAGSYVVSGRDAGLTAARTLTADAGTYSLAGQDAALVRGRTLVADSGAYSLTGQDAALTRGGYVLQADSGTYGLTGNAASLLYNGQEASPRVSTEVTLGGRLKRKKVIIGDRLYEVNDYELEYLLEQLLTQQQAIKVERKPEQVKKQAPRRVERGRPVEHKTLNAQNEQALIRQATAAEQFDVVQEILRISAQLRSDEEDEEALLMLL